MKKLSGKMLYQQIYYTLFISIVRGCLDSDTSDYKGGFCFF